MQKWEYRRLTFLRNESLFASWQWKVGDYYPGNVGTLQITPYGPDEYLGMLGEQGWELVSVADDWYYLKRPKCDPDEADSVKANAPEITPAATPGWELKLNPVQAEIVFEKSADGVGYFVRPKMDNAWSRQEWPEIQRLAAEGWDVVTAFPKIVGHEVLLEGGGGCGSSVEAAIVFLLKRPIKR